MAPDPLRIIIVDDSEIYRSGLRDLINRHPGMRVVAEAADAEGAIEAARNCPADLLLLDLSLPGASGYEVLKSIRGFSDIKVLILTIYESPPMIADARALGAQGFCIKDVSRKELITAIIEAAEGRDYVCRKSDVVLTFDKR
jgi:two-component system NarL family response regulator